MSTIWIRDIRGGLDTRKMPETLSGGSAIFAQDGHVNRGGEFEQRAAFVPTYTLPAGLTYGLACDQAGLYVFGTAAAPAMPRGVTYQQIQHPDGATSINRILSFDLFSQKIYVVAEFTDGTIHHFYDGALVTDWQDGRARLSFLITGGGLQPATVSAGAFTVTGGSNTSASTFADITLNGVSILGAPVQCVGNNSATAAAIAAQVNAFVSTPDYSASATGGVVAITSAPGPAANGFVPVLVLTGDADAAAITPMTGGADPVYSQMVDLKVNGVSVLDNSVVWTTDNATTAAEIADSINAVASKPDYTATVVDNKINLLAVDPGATQNGFLVTADLANGFTTSLIGGVGLAGGLDPGELFQSGAFAKTIGSKVYVASGPDLNFSGVLLPTGFQTTNVGAGFIDMSTQAAGSEALQAVGKYLTFVAVFAERIVQIWYFDPDPSLNAIQQILSNIGTLSPRSVTQFGDTDLFFLDESGVRSLKARYASVSASTDDIGIPVDAPIQDKIRAMTTIERSKIIGLIEPTDGRFWLVFRDQIFVFSFFNGSKVSAWSTYTPSFNDVPFSIDDAIAFKKKVVVRSGDEIYVYGGIGSALQYDATSPELWLPYLDGDKPAVTKDFKTLDVACEGVWEISAACDPTNLDAVDKVATVDKTTYGGPTIPFEISANHVSLRFKGVGPGGVARKIASAVMTFQAEPEAE